MVHYIYVDQSKTIVPSINLAHRYYILWRGFTSSRIKDLCENIQGCGPWVEDTTQFPMMWKLWTLINCSCKDNVMVPWRARQSAQDKGCKHNKVDNSWSLHKFKWKWYTNKNIQHNILTLNFVKRRILNILTPRWSTKAINLCWQNQSQENLHILEVNANESASGDIEQVIFKILLKTW